MLAHRVERVERALHQRRVEPLGDHHDPGAAHALGPSLQVQRGVDQMLHRTTGSSRLQLKQSLEPKHNMHGD